MHCITTMGIMQMNSELDKIKSTITLSLGAKNRLRKLKGSQSYEKYINYLIRIKEQNIQKADNLIEVQKFIRKKGIYSYKDFKILFSYNKYNNSQNYIFDIKIEIVRERGKEISIPQLIAKLSGIRDRKHLTSLKVEYAVYFELLKIAIQNEIEPLFEHRGTFADYYSWINEFKFLTLPRKSVDEDIIAKLQDYKFEQGVL